MLFIFKALLYNTREICFRYRLVCGSSLKVHSYCMDSCRASHALTGFALSAGRVVMGRKHKVMLSPTPILLSSSLFLLFFCPVSFVSIKSLFFIGLTASSHPSSAFSAQSPAAQPLPFRLGLFANYVRLRGCRYADATLGGIRLV